MSGLSHASAETCIWWSGGLDEALAPCSRSVGREKHKPALSCASGDQAMGRRRIHSLFNLRLNGAHYRTSGSLTAPEHLSPVPLTGTRPWRTAHRGPWNRDARGATRIAAGAAGVRSLRGEMMMMMACRGTGTRKP
eukprot:1142644-Pelagomonas_calceolata.AAC.1